MRRAHRLSLAVGLLIAGCADPVDPAPWSLAQETAPAQAPTFSRVLRVQPHAYSQPYRRCGP